MMRRRLLSLASILEMIVGPARIADEEQDVTQ